MAPDSFLCTRYIPATVPGPKDLASSRTLVPVTPGTLCRDEDPIPCSHSTALAKV